MWKVLAICWCALACSAQSQETYADLLAKAHAGDGQADLALAKLYEYPHSRHVPDMGGAAFWYTEAWKRGVPEAATALARFYLTGTGVPRDDTKALNLLGDAAKAGYPLAMVRLGEVMIATNYNGNGEYFGKPWIERAASAGEPDALNDLGWLVLHQSPYGTAPQIRVALSLYEKAVDKGSCAALLNVGLLYLHGSYEFRFAQDAAEAQRWFKRVEACSGASEELKAQAEDLAVHTARGEMPELSRVKPLPEHVAATKTEEDDWSPERKARAYAATVAFVGLVVALRSVSPPNMHGVGSAACDNYQHGLGGSEYACLP